MSSSRKGLGMELLLRHVVQIYIFLLKITDNLVKQDDPWFLVMNLACEIIVHFVLGYDFSDTRVLRIENLELFFARISTDHDAVYFFHHTRASEVQHLLVSVAGAWNLEIP